MEKVDRRIRKTRALLTSGLITLMKEKDIKDISVKELSDLIDISRGTFYLHYDDIYDMVRKLEDNLFEEFETSTRVEIADKTDITSYYDVVLEVCNILDQNRELTRVLIGPHGDLQFVNRMKALFQSRLKNILSTISLGPESDYYYAFAVSGFIGVFESWLRMEHPATPEELTNFCLKIMALTSREKK